MISLRLYLQIKRTLWGWIIHLHWAVLSKDLFTHSHFMWTSSIAFTSQLFTRWRHKFKVDTAEGLWCSRWGGGESNDTRSCILFVRKGQSAALIHQLTDCGGLCPFFEHRRKGSSERAMGWRPKKNHPPAMEALGLQSQPPNRKENNLMAHIISCIEAINFPSVLPVKVGCLRSL